jgi:hypothetical protein
VRSCSRASTRLFALALERAVDAGWTSARRRARAARRHGFQASLEAFAPSGGRSVDVEVRSHHGQRYQKGLISRNFAEPSADSNRRPPPYHKFPGVTRVHARSLATQFPLQTAPNEATTMRRETSRVSFLMCPFCVRVPVSILTTGWKAASAIAPTVRPTTACVTGPGSRFGGFCNGLIPKVRPPQAGGRHSASISRNQDGRYGFAQSSFAERGSRTSSEASAAVVGGS